MKQLFFPVVIFAALAGGAWWYISNYSYHPYGPQTTSASTEATPAPPTKPAPAKSPARIASATPEKPAESPAEQTPQPPPAVAEVRNNSAAPPPQPSPQPPPPGALDNVRPGMPENQVVELLGQPTLSAMTSDRGRLDETYVYPRRIPGPFAVIHMSDGRVVGTP